MVPHARRHAVRLQLMRERWLSARPPSPVLVIWFTFKPHAAEQDRPDVAAARSLAQEPDKTDRTAVFMTTRLHKHVAPLRRGVRSERLVCKLPYGHWKTSTLSPPYRRPYHAPLRWMAESPLLPSRTLIPTLKRGDIVIIQRQRHKVPASAKHRGSGHPFLPQPYSSDLNPMSNLFQAQRLRKTRTISTEPGSADF